MAASWLLHVSEKYAHFFTGSQRMGKRRVALELQDHGQRLSQTVHVLTFLESSVETCSNLWDPQKDGKLPNIQ